jgi:hypothetical protein
MRHFILPIIAVAAVLATVQPGFADPVAATVSDHVQAAALATERPARPAPPSSVSSDATAPAAAGHSEDIVPVGFGWG